VFGSTDDGHVLDCEPGNATPAQAVDWVLMRRRAGVDPTVYCGRNTWWQDIRAAFRARNVVEPHYWLADYSLNPPAIPTGAVALQYRDAGSYDLSIVADYWPGVDPAPAPPPARHRPEEDAMMIIRGIQGSKEKWAQIGSRYWHIASPADMQAYQRACTAAGVPLLTLEVTAAEHANILASAATPTPLHP
jgi:hypothetical protein